MYAGLKSLVGLSVLAASATAKLVEIDWNVTYVTANPNGLAERRVIGVNGQWP